MKQKAIILQSNRTDKALQELNDLLEQGWIFANSCPMPSSISSDNDITQWIGPTCLVILQKD